MVSLKIRTDSGNTNSTDLSGAAGPLFGAIAGTAGTLILNALRSEWREPKLEMRHEAGKLFSQEFTETPATPTSVRKRIKISNTGRTTARGVTGKLIGIVDEDGKKIETDHITLAWTRHGPKDAIDILRKDCDWLGLVIKEKNSPGFKIYASEGKENAGMNLYYEGKSYLFRVALFGALDPVEKTFVITNTGNEIGDIAVAKQPSAWRQVFPNLNPALFFAQRA